jgi:hypothetical protein
MNRLFYIIILGYLITSCGGSKGNDTQSPTTIMTSKDKQLNISILLDLSDRISPKINPNALEYDIENIKTITEYFTADMKRLNAYNAKGKIKVYLIPPPTNSDINSIVSKLNIDCSKMDNKGRKVIYDTLTELYTLNLEHVYNETIARSDWIGSNIWGFFKDDVKDYCIESDTNYRNILIIMTDGYLYHDHSKYNKLNRYSYLLNSNLNKFRNQNWKDLIEQNDFGIMTERSDLNNLEVLVLEIRAEKKSNKIDEDIIQFILKKWLKEMNVSRYEVYRSDLPANTKIRIDKFLN